MRRTIVALGMAALMLAAAFQLPPNGTTATLAELAAACECDPLVQTGQFGGSWWCRWLPWLCPQPAPPPPPPEPTPEPEPEPDPDPPPANAYFSDSFERTINAGGTHGWTSALSLHMPHRMSPSQFVTEINQVENPDRFWFASDYSTAGNYSLGVRVTGCCDHWQNQSNVRNEIERRYLSTSEGEVGDESWYRFDFLIPPAYPNNLPSGSSIIVTQFLKENNSEAPYPYPTFDLQLAPNGSGHRFRSVWHRTLSSYSDRWRIDHGTVAEGRWYNVCFHIKWATNNTGFARLYIDEAPTRTNYENRPTLPARGNYHRTFNKIGGYGWGTSNGVREFRYDNYQVGKGAPPFLRTTTSRILRDAAEDAVTAPFDAVREGLPR